MHAMRGLLWEQWRQGRTVFTAVMLTELSYFLLVKALLGEKAVEDFVTPALLMGLLAFVMLLPNHCLRGYCWNIPPRMSTLPVSRGKVFAAMLAYRLGVALCLGLCIDLGAMALSNGAANSFPATCLLLILGTWVSLFSLAATRFGMGVGALVVILPACLLFLLGSILLNVSLYPSLFLLGVLGAGFTLLKVMQSGILSRYAGSIAGIEAGTWGPFTSTLAGVLQEWRQSYCWLPLLGTLLSVLLVALLGESAMELFYLAPVVVAFGVGYDVFRNDEQMPFVRLLRPVTTRRLAHVRLLSGGTACLLTAAATLAVAACLPEPPDAQKSMLGLLLFWVALFTGRLVLVVGLATLPLWLCLAELDNDFISVTAIWSTMAAVLISLYVSAWKRDLLRLPELILAACLCVGTLFTFVESGIPEDWLAGPFLGMLAMLPVAWVPLTIDWQRHR